MSKLVITTEVEVSEDMNKFEKYAFGRGALSNVINQMAEEKRHGEINLIGSSGSWNLKEVEDEVE